MKKLLAVATLVGAASGTAIAVSSETSVRVACSEESVQIATPVIPPIAKAEPVPAVRVIQPLELRSGWPACGNLVDKAGFTHRRPCPTPQQQLTGVVVDSAITGLR